MALSSVFKYLLKQFLNYKNFSQLLSKTDKLTYFDNGSERREQFSTQVSSADSFMMLLFPTCGNDTYCKAMNFQLSLLLNWCIKLEELFHFGRHAGIFA